MQRWHTEPERVRDLVEVIACEPQRGGFRVQTSPTILYPEGGGQPADHGWVGGVPVLDVQRVEGVVWLSTPAAVAVGPAEVVLDASRRLDHAQQHTGQHLLSAVLEDRHGAPTTSFHLGVEVCAIEVASARLPALEVLEEEVDREVRAGRRVLAREVAADALGGLGVRSRGLPGGHAGPVRLVEIEGLDLNTCGGTHVASTADLGAVALLGVERGRGGTSRLSFVVGGRVRRRLRAAEGVLADLTTRLQVGREAHGEAVARLQASVRDQDRRIDALVGALADARAEALLARPEGVLHDHDGSADLPALQALAGRVARARPEALILLTGGEEEGVFLLAGPPERVATLGPQVAARLGGRGGGAAGRFQGRAGDLGARETVLAWLRAGA